MAELPASLLRIFKSIEVNCGRVRVSLVTCSMLLFTKDSQLSLLPHQRMGSFSQDLLSSPSHRLLILSSSQSPFSLLLMLLVLAHPPHPSNTPSFLYNFPSFHNSRRLLGLMPPPPREVLLRQGTWLKQHVLSKSVNWISRFPCCIIESDTRRERKVFK